MGVIAVMASIGMMYQFIVNPHKPGAFGGDSWWNNMRPVHAFLYLLFAVLVVVRPKDAWMVLALDVVIGIVAFSRHYIVKY